MPPIVVALQQAVKSEAGEAYHGFLAKSSARRPASPRDLLTVREGTQVPLDEVEPPEGIRRRFISSAMSLGALSPEAHTTLSIAMNRMGARSNSGDSAPSDIAEETNRRRMPSAGSTSSRGTWVPARTVSRSRGLAGRRAEFLARKLW